MANENVINTRIQLKYDSYQNWTTNNPTLLPGEVAIAKLVTGTQIDVSKDTTNTAPVLFKVGPGAFNSLPWISGLAADVYAWAKKETPDWADFPALPITIDDNGTGKFVTDIDYSNNKITITRSDAVNSLAATDDDVVILTVDKTTGDVTVDGKHAEKGPANGYTGTQAATEINSFGQGITIKVPKLGVDKYGHTNTAEEVEYKITLPTPEAAVNTVTTVTKKDAEALTVEDKATDGNHAYEIGLKLDSSGNVALSQSDNGLKAVAAEYSVIKDDNSGEYAAIYHLTKDGVNIGTAINIPKDLVVKSGRVVTNPEGQPAGTYIELTLQNDDKPLYINVGSLIEYVTSGSNPTDKVVINIDDAHKVTATITAGAIESKELAANAVITEKITDKNVTKAKLSDEVQTSLGKADTALQESDFNGEKPFLALSQGENNGEIKLVANFADGAMATTISTASVKGLTQTAFLEPGSFELAGSINKLKNDEITPIKNRLDALEDGTSIYNVDEVNTGANDVKYLIFNCGSATTLVD